MVTDVATVKEPLWLLIEAKILELPDQDLAGGGVEPAIRRLAGELDESGHNVSRDGGHMLELRSAMAARLAVGRPLLKDFNDALAALQLEDVVDPHAAAMKLTREVGQTWPRLRGSERRPDVLRIVRRTKLDLLVAKAKGLEGDKGVRLLIDEGIAADVIVERLGVSDEEFARVNAAVEAERAERARAAGLLKAVEGKSADDKVKHLITHNVADELIVELAQVEQSTIDGVKQAMEAELREQERLRAEEEARKKAEAEGPALDAIPADELLEHIESVREILEFSDVEDEIRTMCEQSSIPKALVDIAVSEPDKLDELEANAEG